MDNAHRQQIIELARCHAEGAVDQRGAYGADYDSFDAYHDNMYDTLRDMGLDGDADAVTLADREFCKRLRGLRVKRSETVWVR